MRPTLFLLPATLVVATLVTGCASNGGIPKHDPKEHLRDRYTSYAGPPINSFSWLGRYDSWEPIGNNQLVVYTTPFDAYLLTVNPPCTDLPWANSIGLTSTGSTVSTGFDSVKVGRSIPCQISQIRKVDVSKMKADMRAESDKAKADAATAK
jgi:Family of unknown function (DUF6491)